MKTRGSEAPPNKGMKLTKPENLVGSWLISPGIIESGFAAYAQCSLGRFIKE